MRYREVVGSLTYAVTCTRPDICWVVTRLSQFLSNPRQKHWTVAMHVLRYLKGALDYELCCLNLVLVTVRPCDLTSVHPFMYANTLQLVYNVHL